MRWDSVNGSVGGAADVPGLDVGRLWASAIEPSPLAIVMVRGADHDVGVANGAFRRLVGVPEERLLHRPLLEALPFEAGPPLRSILDRVRARGVSETVTDVRYAHPRGGLRFLDLEVWPIRMGGRDPFGLSIHVTDATDRQNAREEQRRLASALREVNERLVLAAFREQDLADRARAHVEQVDALVRSMNGGAVILDASGDVALVNPWGARVLGFDESRLPIRPHAYHRLDFRYPDLAPLRAEDHPFARALREERFANVELLLVRSDETSVRLSFNGSAILDGSTGKAALAIVVFQDVTELRRLEELRAEYTTIISHDLAAPLTAIKGYADLLEIQAQRAGQPRPAEQARRIGVAASRMAAMLGDLVESARLDAGTVRLDRRPIDPVDLVRELVERIGSQDDRRRIRVEAARTVSAVTIDRDRIERAITNLVTNALKYSPPDARVGIRIEQGDGEVLISVIDCGPGIQPDALARIFERFYTSRDRAHGEGLGLGLYIARQIVDAHGGRIWAQSEPGRGATFSIALPLA